MNEDRMAKWIGIATNLSVLAGVILLVVEIQQNNQLAAFDSIQERRYIAQQSEMAFYDRDVSEVWTKSIIEPGSLTLTEIRVMDAYMTVNMMRAYTMLELEDAGLMPKGSAQEWIEAELYFLFSNEFSRIWWEQFSPDWPEISEIVTHYIGALKTNMVKNDLLAIQRALQELPESTIQSDP